jgi:hypothetical protein
MRRMSRRDWQLFDSKELLKFEILSGSCRKYHGAGRLGEALQRGMVEARRYNALTLERFDYACVWRA